MWEGRWSGNGLKYNSMVSDVLVAVRDKNKRQEDGAGNEKKFKSSSHGALLSR